MEQNSSLSEQNGIVIVGLSGKIGAGKTTVSRILSSYMGSRWISLAFSEPLKEFCAIVYDFPIDDANNSDGKRNRPAWAIVDSVDDLFVPTFTAKDVQMFIGLEIPSLIPSANPELTRIQFKSGLFQIIARTEKSCNTCIQTNFSLLVKRGLPITIGCILQIVGDAFRRWPMSGVEGR